MKNDIKLKPKDMDKAEMDKKIKEFELYPIRDVNKPEPTTVIRIQQLAKMLSKGKSKSTVMEYAMKEYDIGERQAKSYYNAACRYLIPENIEEYRISLLQTNINRLEKIVEKCIDSKNASEKAIAIQAIKEINNCLSPKNNNVTIARNDNGEEIIQIDFN